MTEMSSMKEPTPEALAPPPPIVHNPNRTPTARGELGTKGLRIPLLTNHFRVQLERTEDFFYQYSAHTPLVVTELVQLPYNPTVATFRGKQALNLQGQLCFSSMVFKLGHFILIVHLWRYCTRMGVEAKGVGRRVLDRVHNFYNSEFEGKGFAYDGEKTLFTVGPLHKKILEFPVVMENLSSNRTVRGGSTRDNDTKRSRRAPESKSYTVKINYATRIPIQAIFNALKGQESEQFNEAVRVLDVLLRQHAAKQGCLLVRQCFFHNDPRNSIGIGGGVVGCRGFHSSFRATQAGLSLNMDVSTTMIVKPGKVVDFLLENQNVRDIKDIDWTKARRMLKSLRIKTFPSNLEHKIIGLSEKTCRDQKFTMKQKNGKNPGETIEITVFDYYLKHRDTELKESRNLSCLDVGKPKRPVYIPLEFCELISLQRYTKSLSNLQRASLVEKSRQKPHDRMKTLMGALNQSNYNADPLINSTGITISTTFTEVQGRVLEPPKLKFGNGGDLLPRGGRWNFNNKTLVDPKQIKCWAIVNFSARCDIPHMCTDLLRCSGAKGMVRNFTFCNFS
ncbi:argonaute 4A-like protein [Tanacetum coccineum]